MHQTHRNSIHNAKHGSSTDTTPRMPQVLVEYSSGNSSIFCRTSTRIGNKKTAIGTCYIE